MATYIGVYSTLTPRSKGERDAGKRKRYWFAWDNGDAGYGVQALDGAFQPEGDVLPIEPSTFRASFSLEPSILVTPVRRGSPSRPSQDGASPPKTPAQYEAERVEVENHLRAYFGALLLKIRLGDDAADALKAMEELAAVEEGIVAEHKYMFSDFGIDLRKGKQPKIALAHAKRAISLAPGDSHAHFNIARIYYVLDKLDEAEQHLLAALEFSPDLEYARDFLVYLGKERRQKALDARRGRRL
jgi:tetratricopeptide (TPR) repeat protein